MSAEASRSQEKQDAQDVYDDLYSRPACDAVPAQAPATTPTNKPIPPVNPHSPPICAIVVCSALKRKFRSVLAGKIDAFVEEPIKDRACQHAEGLS